MDLAAAAMNDAAKSIYPYATQVPYLNMALQSLQEIFEINDVHVVDTVSNTISAIPAGTTALVFGGSDPKLPDDLIEPKVLWESPTGLEQWVPMNKLDFLPRYEAGVEIPQYIWFTWQSNEVRFLPANAVNDIKMDYIRRLFTPVTATDGNDQLNVINGQNYLAFKTAEYMALMIAENPTRAQGLAAEAERALDSITGITLKGKQAIVYRRRPFRAGYKRRMNF